MPPSQPLPRTAALPWTLVGVFAAIVLVQQYVISLGAQPDGHVLERFGGRRPPAPQPKTRYYNIAFGEAPLLEDVSRAGDDAWAEALMPRRGGFLWVRHNASMSVEYGISMFHAMHCLQMLRSVVQDAVAGAPSHPHGTRPGHRSSSPGVSHEKHGAHCIGYLAQYIACAGDDTVEPPWLHMNEAGEIVAKGVDGKGARHVCRDTSSLWELSRASEQRPVEPWGWSEGDTVARVFGSARP